MATPLWTRCATDAVSTYCPRTRYMSAITESQLDALVINYGLYCTGLDKTMGYWFQSAISGTAGNEPSLSDIYSKHFGNGDIPNKFYKTNNVIGLELITENSLTYEKVTYDHGQEGTGNCMDEGTGWISWDSSNKLWNYKVHVKYDAAIYQSGGTCPEYSHWDNGYCIADPGYVWDEGSGKFIPINCILIDGDNEIGCNSSVQYLIINAEHAGNDLAGNDLFNKVNVVEDTKIYLSYGGSSIIKGVDFTALDSVTIPTGSSEVKITIRTHTSQAGLIKIIGETANGVDSCSEFDIVLDCENPDPNPGPGVPIYPDPKGNCMDFFFYPPYGHQTKKAGNM